MGEGDVEADFGREAVCAEGDSACGGGDARRAVEDLGVDGIVVSNHAGRQVDGAIASLDALENIVEGVFLSSVLLVL